MTTPLRPAGRQLLGQIVAPPARRWRRRPATPSSAWGPTSPLPTSTPWRSAP